MQGEFLGRLEQVLAPIGVPQGLPREGVARPEPQRTSDRLFRAADWLAMHFQRQVLLSMRALYTMAALMAIAFAVYDNLPSQDDMIFRIPAAVCARRIRRVAREPA